MGDNEFNQYSSASHRISASLGLHLFTDAFQNGLEELAHRLAGSRAQSHELRVLAEMIEEELPDGPEVFLDLHFLLQVFELSQIQSHKSSCGKLSGVVSREWGVGIASYPHSLLTTPHSPWRAAFACSYFVTPRSDVSMKLTR